MSDNDCLEESAFGIELNKPRGGALDLPGQIFDRNFSAEKKDRKKCYPAFLADKNFKLDSPYLHIVDQGPIGVSWARLFIENWIGVFQSMFPFLGIAVITLNHNYDKIVESAAIVYNMKLNRKLRRHDCYSGCGCNPSHECHMLCVHEGHKYFHQKRQTNEYIIRKDRDTRLTLWKSQRFKNWDDDEDLHEPSNVVQRLIRLGMTQKARRRIGRRRILFPWV